MPKENAVTMIIQDYDSHKKFRATRKFTTKNHSSHFHYEKQATEIEFYFYFLYKQGRGHRD
jgi:hypothetical protein